jgi:hypothetical protein
LGITKKSVTLVPFLKQSLLFLLTILLIITVFTVAAVALYLMVSPVSVPVVVNPDDGWHIGPGWG